MNPVMMHQFETRAYPEWPVWNKPPVYKLWLVIFKEVEYNKWDFVKLRKMP